MRTPLLPSLLAATLVLGGCQSSPPLADAGAPMPFVAAPTSAGIVYLLQPEPSRTTIYVYRAGRAAHFGHNHVLTVPQLEGWVQVPDDQLNAARFSLRFRLDQLQVDDAALRAATGGGFSTPRSADDIAGTQHNMLKSLDADHDPWVVLNSVTVVGEWPVAVADVAVTLHGVTRVQRVVLHLQHTARELGARGSLVVRQSDFGIKPFSILGGALGVDDTLAIDFDLQLQAISRTP
ncbi:YceI family protein [Solimonas terrae]|uniref:YceI family protein n=1 Tax=Solimonas terrae TaxID=1396819 RepID=A0A6M2BQD1_9GAMM|nr:YceI family protein [Solimonas terrae]NGY04816.1 YceI family protein [Solimonas terrae]